MRIAQLLIAIAALAALTGCGKGGEAVAAAPSTATSPSPTGATGGLTRTELARSVLAGGGPAEFKPGLDTVIVKITLEPGASTGWHGHSDGGAFVVTKGTLANYGLDGAPCKAVDVSAGHAYFVPPHPKYPHLARNNGTETAEAIVYYFNVPVGQKTAHPAAPPPECPAGLS